MAKARGALPRDLLGTRVHFVGIGGIGMSGLAHILLSAGVKISGSDRVSSPITEGLARRGARIVAGHAATHAEGAGLVVVTDAVKWDRNPEVAWAQAHGVPVLRRSELVGRVTAGHPTVAVAGTHGKTTTAAILTHILRYAEMNPTYLLGGEAPTLGGNAGLGGNLWVIEACEAYESYLDVTPTLAVVTNIETDHLDHHGTPEALRESFQKFAQRVAPGGTLVLCGERPELEMVATSAGDQCCVVRYALDAECEYTARGQWALQGWGGQMVVYARGERQGEVVLPMPGRHNLLNAMGAVAVAHELGASSTAVREALASFTGVTRRFEKVAEVNGVTIVDDYAHHPTEVRVALATARAMMPDAGRLVAVFQPHLFSRTRDLLEDFATAFDDADQVIITAIYPAREAPIPGVTGEVLAERIHAHAPPKPVTYLPGEPAIVEYLAEQLHHGDWAMILGAGSIGTVAWDLARVFAGERV